MSDKVKRYTDALDNLLDRPIAFNPSFKKITGSTNAALLLSQAFYWMKRTSNKDGWFYKTREDWMDETGLTAEELDGARAKCRTSGVIEEKLAGVPATVHYRVVKAKVYELLGFQFGEIPQSGLSDLPQIGGKPESGSDPDFNKESEITPGITTERVPALDFRNMTVPQARKLSTIRLYIEATEQFPASVLWETVHNTITEKALTFEQLRSAAIAWIGKGYRPENVTGILEWATNGIPVNGKTAQPEQKPAINEAVVEATKQKAEDKWNFTPAPPPPTRPQIRQPEKRVRR
jgi:hypothetical protein